MKWFLFLVLAGFSWSARLIGAGRADDPIGSALLSLGCLIIGGVLAGELAVRFRFPRITGYLILGMAAGPHALGLQTARDASLLRIFEDLALGLIALTAGGEFRFSLIRRRFRPLLAITAAHAVGILMIVSATLWSLARFLPFLGPVGPAEAAVAALILGVIAVAVSPATTVAVITDLKARGEMVETVLGVTIAKDLVILVLFTAINAAAVAWLGGEMLDIGVLGHVGGEIVVSLVVGLIFGVVLGFFIATVGRMIPLTVILLALTSAELAQNSWVEHMLVCMAAGFAARNFFPTAAGDFLDALEQSSMPVYVVFFALVGAGLDLGIFRSVWLPVLIYVAIRLAAVWATTRWSAAAAGSGWRMVRYGWMGFVAQAGLSLGLAARMQRELPGIGPTIAALVIAAVVVNQLLGPVLWQWAIVKSGEDRRK